MASKIETRIREWVLDAALDVIIRERVNPPAAGQTARVAPVIRRGRRWKHPRPAVSLHRM